MNLYQIRGHHWSATLESSGLDIAFAATYVLLECAPEILEVGDTVIGLERSPYCNTASFSQQWFEDTFSRPLDEFVMRFREEVAQTLETLVMGEPHERKLYMGARELMPKTAYLRWRGMWEQSQRQRFPANLMSLALQHAGVLRSIDKSLF